MSTADCPACDAPILVVDGSRHGGQREAFDPGPGTGEHYDTKLSADLSHIEIPAAGASNLRGRIPLHRNHRWTCREQMRVPADRPVPHIGGYSQGAAPRRDAQPAPEQSWPQPWDGITGTVRDDLGDLLSLAPEAMPRRRLMIAMTYGWYRAAAGMTARRMQGPQQGDLVVETASGRKPGGERKGIGILLGRRREAPGEDSRSPADAWYVQYGPGEQDVERWEGAAFIAVLTSDRASDGA